jgi:hypothetical protein
MRKSELASTEFDLLLALLNVNGIAERLSLQPYRVSRSLLKEVVTFVPTGHLDIRNLHTLLVPGRCA